MKISMKKSFKQLKLETKKQTLKTKSSNHAKLKNKYRNKSQLQSQIPFNERTTCDFRFEIQKKNVEKNTLNKTSTDSHNQT